MAPWTTSTGQPSPTLAYSIAPQDVSTTWLPRLYHALAGSPDFPVAAQYYSQETG